MKATTELKIERWEIDFLTAYIINVHHQPLRSSLAAATVFLERFVARLEKKFPYLPQLLGTFKKKLISIHEGKITIVDPNKLKKLLY